MGNEGSLPTDEDIEGFEYQARSPPSAIPPGGTSQTYVSGNTNGGGQGSGGHGGRLKGNPFKRGNHAHNQNSFGIERAPGQSLSSYPTPIQEENLAYMGQSSVGVGGQHHPQQQAYPSHAQHPQQYTQQQQQQMYAQQQYQQQQHQQQQQHYDPQGQQPLYAQVGRKARPGQRAGAAILNGMRNLNISSAMNRIGSGVGKSPGESPSRINKRQQEQQHQQRRQQQQQTVNEWETRWDEDSDEEDEDVKPGMLPPQQHSIAGADGVPTTAMTAPLGPPELDSGFSGATAALLSPTKPMGEQQLQTQQGQQTIFPPTAAAAVTPSTLGTPTPSEQKSPDQTVTDDEIENGNDDDGVEWDTGKSTTPNVEQFMPLLRVLGKGSFGKVRIIRFFLCCQQCNEIVCFIACFMF